MIDLNTLLSLSVKDLCQRFKVEYERTSHQNLIYDVIKGLLFEKEEVKVTGVLESISEHFCFLRYFEFDLRSTKNDIYFATNKKGFGKYKQGDLIECTINQTTTSKYFQPLKILSVNRLTHSEAMKLLDFKSYDVIFPNKRIKLSEGFDSKVNRLIDLVTPLGYGQRGMIAAAPKCGKTTILENIAKAFNALGNEVIILMIAERPEETTYLKDRLPKDVKVIASNFDEEPQRHVQLTKLITSYCMRQTECNRDIILLIDSLTRFVRAANLLEQSSKLLTGGLDAQSLLKIKSILGAARNLRGGATLTVLTTVLIETGSKMDEVILDECKGTSNWDLILSRELIQKGYFPGVDLQRSSTRRIDLLIEDKIEVNALNLLRKVLLSISSEEALVRLLEQIRSTSNNKEILDKFTNSIDS